MTRARSSLLLALAALALLARAVHAQPAPARVLSIELDRSARADLVLVQLQGERTPQLTLESATVVVLRIPHAELGPRAPQHLPPAGGTAIRGVRAGQEADAVAIRIERTAGAVAQLSQRGSLVAVEFAKPPPDVARTTLRLKDAPLAQLVGEVQRITGKSFVYDERLQGSATVIVTEAVTHAEALELLHATLLAKGFAAVPSSTGAFVVLPVDEARARSPRQQRPSPAGAGLITALVHFRDIAADALVSVLQPFAGGTVTTIAHAPTNGVILVGPEASVARWLELARAVDETSRRELVVLRPRWRSAEELYGLLSELVVDPLTGRARAELFLDARTNALLLRGEPIALAALRARLAELDVEPDSSGEVAVIRTRFADPEKLAALLHGLASGDASAQSQLPEGARALAGAGFSVAVHAPTRALVVSGDAALQRAVREVVEQLDVEPPTITVSAKVLEVVTTGARALGFDAFLPTTDPANPGRTVFGLAVGDPFDQVADPLDPTFIARYARDPFVVPVIGPGGVPVNVTLPRDIVQIKAAEGDTLLRTLMEPHLVTTSGEEHEFSAGLNVPIPSAASESAAATPTGEAGSDPLTTRTTIERQDVGLRLRLKPTAGQAGDVRIGVDLELTNLLPTFNPGRSDIGPALARRALQATTTVRDGGVAVLGMLLERSDSHADSGPPFVKDVPVLGTLLAQRLDRQGERRLVIALQAHIERGADERLADTIRLRTAHERALARHGPLRDDRAGWALLVATRTSAADADALAERLGEIAGKRARVVAWEWAGAQRWDVVLSGFARVGDTAAALAALEALGWSPELIALPAR